MLQEAQRTSAPSAVSVSISTAVWMVMCSEPVIRAPSSGLAAPNSAPRALERLGGAELGPQRHQAGHLGLGDLDLLAAEIGEIEVGDDIVAKLGLGLARPVLVY